MNLYKYVVKKVFTGSLMEGCSISDYAKGYVLADSKETAMWKVENNYKSTEDYTFEIEIHRAELIEM